MQARIWKRFELKNSSSSLLYRPISSSAETWKIFRKMLCYFFFFAWADILSAKKTHILESIFFLETEQGLITHTSFVHKSSRLVRISLLISAINKRVFPFFSGKLFHKSNGKLFFSVYAYPNIITPGAGRFLDRYANLTPDFISGLHNCVSNSPNPWLVYIRLCKRGKRFLLLK